MTHRLWLRFRRTFLTGLVVLTPLLVTVWVLYLFTERLDRLFQPWSRPSWGTRFRVSGSASPWS
jgi:uncharacterized membrane protein